MIALDDLEEGGPVLVIGAGGGFDVYCGIPFAIEALERGHRLVLANVSFAPLLQCGGEQVRPTLWRVDRSSIDLPYFPERWLCEWLARRNIELPVYALQRSGVVPLVDAIDYLVSPHQVSRVVLVDGGTDGVLFGDEPGLGSVAEDAVTLVAVQEAGQSDAVLIAIGFGVDHFHGVSHHAFLENAAQLQRDGAFIGTGSVVAGTTEGEAFLDLVGYANSRQPRHQSIVLNSIASAVRGEFGDFQATPRTLGSELFINPLMSQMWFFRAIAVVRRMKYAEELKSTHTINDASSAIEAVRQRTEVRRRRAIPL